MKNFIWEVEEKVFIHKRGFYWSHVNYFDVRSEAREFIKEREHESNFKITKKYLFFEKLKKKYYIKNLCECGALYDKYCPNCGDDDYEKRVLAYQDEEGSWRLKGE